MAGIQFLWKFDLLIIWAHCINAIFNGGIHGNIFYAMPPFIDIIIIVVIPCKSDDLKLLSEHCEIKGFPFDTTSITVYPARRI